MDWLQIYVDDCMGNSQGWLLKMVRRSPFFQLQRVWKAGHGFILNYCACGWQQQGRRKGWKSGGGASSHVVYIICPLPPCWDSFNQGVLQRSLVQNLGGGWGHFPLGPRYSDSPGRYKQCVCCSPVGLFVQFAWNLEMCGGYLAAVVFGTYGMVWQNTVRSKEDLNPKGVVLLGFCRSSIAH